MKWLLLFSLFFIGITGSAQENTGLPPYKRFPTLPPIQLLLGDSTSKYTTDNIPEKKPVLLMIFSPECSHCQHTAEEMYAHREELKDIQIIMATMFPLYQVNDFMHTYKLSEMKNVVAGKDIYFLLPPFYAVKSLPYLAMYNKKRDLILGFEGSMSVQKIIAVFKDNK